MYRYPRIVLVLALLTTTMSAQSLPRLAGFKAYLFNSKTGQLSQDVLAARSELGNVPIGSYSSVSTFVVVRVELGPQAPVPANAQVRLIALEGGTGPLTQRQKSPGRILLDALGKLGPLDDQGGTYVGFWLPATGCRTITLKASLRGAGPAATFLTEVLPFTCYE